MIAHFENRKRAEVMAQSRITKARRGEAVSKLPVGWIKGPDGKYDFDPETADTIRIIIDTFWQTRSTYRTVKALVKAGVQIPYRDGQRICFRKPSVNRVLRILKNPNYAGTYVYGKSQSHPGGPCWPTVNRNGLRFPKTAGSRYLITIRPTLAKNSKRKSNLF
jgi:Recombinase